MNFINETHLTKQGQFVNLLNHMKSWNKIPELYNTPSNRNTFGYMNYSGLDAEAIFQAEIKNHERRTR